jgi:hypothetical protein
MGYVSNQPLYPVHSYLHSEERFSFENLTWYTGKAEIREYLRELNKGKKVVRSKPGESFSCLNVQAHKLTIGSRILTVSAGLVHELLHVSV